jgi:hypothetical protein
MQYTFTRFSYPFYAKVKTREPVAEVFTELILDVCGEKFTNISRKYKRKLFKPILQNCLPFDARICFIYY